MKNRFLIVVLGLLSSVALAQSDQQNLDKYWKFRASFKKDFIRIGELQGESLPMGRRWFWKTPNFDSTEFGEPRGKLYWGDGVIRHGHYVGFLATEYALLKRNNQDVTATLNELYYALDAFNRLDEDAEPIISGIKPNLNDQPKNLNGFFLRDDVPKKFEEHWKDEPIKARATFGDIYTNNNAQHIDDPNATNHEGALHYARYSAGQWSNPSLDQVTSMLVALKVCDKLIPENLWVKPTANDSVMNIADEVRQITNRIITYAKDHNWFIINMHGWPVGNGGGNLVFTAYPITIIGNQIVGNDYTGTMTRSSNQFYPLASVYFELETQAEKDAMWDTLNIIEKNKIASFNPYLLASSFPLGVSGFEAQQNGGSVSIPTNASQTTWVGMATLWPAIYLDWQDNHKFDNTFGAPIGNISFDRMNISDYNNTIFYNLGVASGLFNKSNSKVWEDATYNHQVALIQALLTDDIPITNQNVYKGMLSAMPVTGSFKFLEQHPNPTSPQFLNNSTYYPTISQSVFPAQWGGEYRWTHYFESQLSSNGNHGQYTGLDYMYLHNLYSLIYEDNLPEFEENYTCICESVNDANLIKEFHIDGIITEGQYDQAGNFIGYDTVQAQKDYIDSVKQLNGGILSNVQNHLNTLENCTPNGLSLFSNNQLNIQHTLGQLHDNYEAMKIWINNYQTETFTVKSSGQLDVKSRMVVCENKTLLVENGGEVNILKGEIRVNSNAVLIIEGDMVIESSTKLILEDSARLVIANGGTLTNKGKIEVKNHAVVEYEDGATLVMGSDNSEMHFNGGDLLVKANANFTFNHGPGHSGQLRFSKWGKHINGEANSTFSINGINDEDPILILEKDADFWSDTPDELIRISIANGRVEMHENSRIVGTQYFKTYNVNFQNMDDLNRGITTFDKTYISNSEFNNVKIRAIQMYRPNAEFTMTRGTVNYDKSGQALYIKGKDYKVLNSTFYIYNSAEGIVSRDLTAPSFIQGTNISGAGETRLVFDNSNTVLKLSGNTLNTSLHGVTKERGTLALRCNSFNNIESPVVLDDLSTLNASSMSDQCGYNTVSNSTETAITFDDAMMPILSEGYNDFSLGSASSKFFEGSIFINFISPMLAVKNGWNGQPTLPSQNGFNIVNNTGNNLGVLANSPDLANCGTYDVYNGHNNPFLRVASSNNLPSLIMPNGGNPNPGRIDNLVGESMSRSELYDSINGHNPDALTNLQYIITYPYNFETHSKEVILPVLDYAFAQLKYTFEDAIKQQQILPSDNQSSFSLLTQLYVDALNKLSTYSQNDNTKRFVMEMEKVHFYHLINQRTMALSILYNTEYCGLNKFEQRHLNAYKYSLEEERSRLTYGYTADLKDTVFADTSHYTFPTNEGPTQYQFGSQINSLYSVVFANSCSGQNESKATNTIEGISVYPNPTKDILSISYSLDEEAVGEIVIYNISGKALINSTLSPYSNTHMISLNNLARGTYLYKYVVNGESIQTGKLVKQ